MFFHVICLQFTRFFQLGNYFVYTFSSITLNSVFSVRPNSLKLEMIHHKARDDSSLYFYGGSV